MKTKLLTPLLLAAALTMQAQAASTPDLTWTGTITQTVTATNDPADYYVGETFTGSYSYFAPTSDGTFVVDTSGYPPDDPGYAIVSSDSLIGEIYTLYPTAAYGLQGTGYPGPLLTSFGSIAVPDPDIELTVVDDQASLDFAFDHGGIWETVNGSTGNAVLYDPTDQNPAEQYPYEDTSFTVTLSDPVDPPSVVPDVVGTVSIAGLSFVLLFGICKWDEHLGQKLGAP